VQLRQAKKGWAADPVRPRRRAMKKVILMLAGLALICQALDAQTSSQPATTSPSERKEPDPRIKKIFEARKIDFEITPTGNFRVVFNLKNGRSQQAFVSSSPYRYMSLDIREIVSPAYRSPTPFAADVANRLLSDNNDKKLGAWVMQKEKDGYYALFVTKVPADCSDEYFIAALRLTLEAADEMEKELTGKDEF
jgi:hypothetical protein